MLWQKAKVVSWFPQLACNVICQLELRCGASRQQRHVFMVKVIMIFRIFFPFSFSLAGVKAKVDYGWIKPKFSGMWAYIKLNLISLKLLLQSWNVKLWMQSQKSITRLSKYIWMISNWFYRFSPHLYDGWNQLVLLFCFLGCILSWKDTIYISRYICLLYLPWFCCHCYSAQSKYTMNKKYSHLCTSFYFFPDFQHYCIPRDAALTWFVLHLVLHKIP